MTIICALQNENIWIGSDTRTTFGEFCFDGNGKWLFGEGKALGMTGMSRAKYLLSLRDDLFKGDVHHTVRVFREAILEDDWPMEDTKGEAKNVKVSGLYASHEGVWIISCDFSALPVPKGMFVADGSGEAFAVGAAYALRGQDTRTIMETAVLAAIQFNTECGGEVFVRHI